MKLARLAGATIVSLAVFAPVIAADKSGPKPGFHITPFHVNDITGQFKGKALCYV